MCGIVGYTGPREAGPILIEGLRHLEYRGYDSAGIALVDEEGVLFVEKKAGKLANLQSAIADRTPHAAIGLAHTRWATHGRPNDLNAHPHQDCTGDITVIHNGIIENFRELRDGLEARGHVLRVRDGHRGDRAPRRGGIRGRPRRCRPGVAPADGRRLRARRDAQGARSAGSSAPARTCRSSWGSTARRASSPATCPRSSRTRTGWCSSRRATSRTSARRASWSPGSTACPGARRHRHRLDAGGRGEGRLRPLHAQGDQRAARGAPPVDRRARDARRPHPRARGRRARGRLPPRHPGGDRRVRDGVLRGARRRGGDPGLDGAAGPGHRRVRVPLLAAAARREHARRRRDAVGRDGRHHRPDALGARAGLPDRRGHEHRGLRDHARGRRRDVPPGRPRDRGRGVEDVRDPGHDADRARGGDRQGTRGRWARSRSWSWARRCARSRRARRGRSRSIPTSRTSRGGT